MNELSIRFAKPEDAPVIFELVHALASYERLAHEMVSCARRPQLTTTRLGSCSQLPRISKPVQ